ncbi:MAG: fibronectin type III domain-containing protein, partial [Bacteroidales bacterium]|nr:fibronectin type III domain-containing protein [Bacteroidales bacterium]
MKRLFLFTMMCLFGLFGSLNAQTEVELNVGIDAQYTGSNKNVPTYTYYNYSFSQQIYTAEEMQELAGSITSIAFIQTKAGAYTRSFSVYMQNIEKSTFTSTYDWIPVSEADLVYTGSVEFPNQAGGWIEMELQTPFEYTGGNLLVCVADNTGSYTSSGCEFDVYQTSAYQTIYTYRDNAVYDITNPGAAKSTIIQKNIVKFDITIEGEFKNIAVSPATIELGNRPNGSWMAPAEVQIKARAQDFVINSIESTNSYFELSEVELPYTVQKGNPLVIQVTSGEGEGEITGQLEITYVNAGEEAVEEVEVVEMTALAYAPSTGDVVETAEAISAYPFTANHEIATLVNNYALPGSGEDGGDVVYVLNLSSDVALTANVTGENGKIAVYTEDFNGEEGPMANNDYKGIQVGSARASQISAQALPAGKYYLVASSTSDFSINVNVEALPAPEKAYSPYPYNQQTGVSNPTLDWEFGANTVEYQLLLGTAYPPKDVIVDWTSDLKVNHYFNNLYNNKIYFWQVNARNTSGTTYGDIWAFTTTFNEPQGLTATSNYLYEGESTTITWNAVNDRSHRGYNVYMNNQKVNKNVLTGNTYTFDNLEYDMYGYYIAVSAVYDEGESNPCDGILVYVTGMTEVSGNLYEQDGVTPLNGGVVAITGTDEFGTAQSYTFTADETGAYAGELLAGNYVGVAYLEGYQNKEVEFTALYSEAAVVDYSLTETYNPVKYITATETEDAVELVWGMRRYSNGFEDFETGDFTANEWNNEVSA